MRIVVAIVLSGLFLMMLNGCTGDSPVSGAGGQTTNGITVSVVYPDGKAGSGLPVRVRQTDYLAEIGGIAESSQQFAVDGMTDSSGVFVADSLERGAYIVEVNDDNGFAVATELRTPDPGGMVDMVTDTLTPTGIVRGCMPPEEQNGKVWYVQIYGLERCAVVDEFSGQFIFDDLPAGQYTFRKVSADSTLVPVAIDEVEVHSNDITVLSAYPAWRYTAKLLLNTTADGADIAGDVADFPVLVRLTENNFPFAQASPTGRDIRFTRGDTLSLPYEIEHWDPVTELAEVWVLVDTIRGNDSMQSITMYWGNADAVSRSNGAEVFDTATGFTGVWHLGESAGDAKDATGNGFNGSRAGDQKRTPGAIGYGQFFDGEGDYFEMGNAGNPDTAGFTVSAWVKASTKDGYRAILSKTYGDEPSSTYGWLVELGEDGALAAFSATGAGEWGDARTFVSGSDTYITDTVSWHHVVAVFDRSGNSNCLLYIDGKESQSFRGGGDITSLGSIINSAPMRLGADAKGGCPWNGIIDECTFSFTVRSADWVKLCYMNQKTDDKLIFFHDNPK